MREPLPKIFTHRVQGGVYTVQTEVGDAVITRVDAGKRGPHGAVIWDWEVETDFHGQPLGLHYNHPCYRDAVKAVQMLVAEHLEQP